jgi:hypothetical protein
MAPLDTQLWGDDGFAYVGGDGILHLTDEGYNFTFGIFEIDLAGPQILQPLEASWKSLIGGGAVGADGYSFNVANDLPAVPTFNNPGEEGAGTGLSATVDTFDNGGGEAPGIELRWRGVRVAFAPTTKEFLRENEFVEASVSVSPAGEATFTYGFKCFLRDGGRLQLASVRFVRVRRGHYGLSGGGGHWDLHLHDQF